MDEAKDTRRKPSPCIHRPKFYAGEILLGATVTSGELPGTVLLTTSQPSHVSIIGEHQPTVRDLIRQLTPQTQRRGFTLHPNTETKQAYAFHHRG
ncbi:hypothetical protein IGI04_005015 [Brassica rapa subsp. trilocularis]|uniref:Uncharacterized protein n=1 Tax=Brassica rapa subsp. trilocularis TaxID=1813537 RepID=A0ABQ7NEV2_BRACM|nr:hypothetical protein IGI04_005015 [Brassica rapa subsp. trilocularis]